MGATCGGRQNQKPRRFVAGPIGRRGLDWAQIKDLRSRRSGRDQAATRRVERIAAHNPRLKTPDIRGNVATRLTKLCEKAELDARILALAGLMQA